MTSTEIRAALTEVGRAVDVPEPDRLDHARRVRALRRRRTSGRALVGVAAAAVVATVVAVGHGGGVAHDTGVAPADQRAVDTAPAAVTQAALLLGGKLHVLLPDGSSWADDLSAEEVLGETGRGIVYLDRQRRLRLVEVQADGRAGEPQALAGGGRVRQAVLSLDGVTYGWVDLQGVLHVRDVGGDVDLVRTPLGSPSATVLAVDGARWLERDGERLFLGGVTTTLRELETGFPATSAELGGSTIGVHTIDGSEFFEADGTPRSGGSLGYDVAALSPDGTHVVSGAGAELRDHGALDDLQLTDTVPGRVSTYDGLSSAIAVLDLSWQDDDRFLVLGEDPQRPGDRVLWDCSVRQGTCVERLDDPTATLRLPTG